MVLAPLPRERMGTRSKGGCPMQQQHQRRRTEPSDEALPILLLVSLVAMLPVIAGVVAVSRSDALWALIAAIAVLLVGMVGVAATIARQLSDKEGDPATVPVRARDAGR
jgi:hypothetical protein